MTEKVLGFLNGDLGDDASLSRWLAVADFVIAADGGANRCLRLGRTPDLTIGDFDSFSGSLLDLPHTKPVLEQATTDCDKLLAEASARGCPSILLAGVEGSLPDHFLATLMSATRFPGSVQIAFDRGIGWMLKPGDRITAPAKGRVSLLPLGEAFVSLAGVEWPLESADLSSSGLVSISNKGLGEASAEIHSGYAFFFVEYDDFPQWPIRP